MERPKMDRMEFLQHFLENLKIKDLLTITMDGWRISIADKLEDIFEHIGPDKDDEDMFAYIWDLKESQEGLTPMILEAEKSGEQTEKLRSQGNVHFQLGDLIKAREHFSDGVLAAPTPPPSTSEANTQQTKGKNGQKRITGKKKAAEKKMKNDGKKLAVCYAERANVLMSAGAYDDCLRDIELAMEFGHPDKPMLITRRKKCLQERGNAINPSLMEELFGVDEVGGINPRTAPFHQRFKLYQQSQPGGHCFSESFRNTLLRRSEIPKPKLVDPHPKIPSLSNALTLAYSKARGRHLIATRDIHPGELLVLEKSVCSNLLDAIHNRMCLVCHVSCLAPLPCPTCSFVGFCSIECRDKGLPGFHQQECVVLKTMTGFEDVFPVLTAFRVLMKLSLAGMKKIIPIMREEEKSKPPEQLGFNEAGVYDPSDFRAIYHLCTNKKYHHKEVLLRRCAEAIVTIKLLEKSGKFFVNSKGEPVKPSREDLILTGATMLRLIMNTRCSVAPLREVKVSTTYTDDMIQPLVGTQLCPTICLFNHSCHPSVAPVSGTAPTACRAIRFIPAGQEATINCHETFYDEDRAERRRIMSIACFFECRCEACENDWPQKDKLPVQVHMKCLECTGPVVCKFGECFNCKKMGKLKNSEAGDISNLVEKNRAVGTKILAAITDFRSVINSKQFVEQSTEEDRQIIINLIEVLDKYAVHPSKVYHEAQEMLMVTYLREGKYNYVPPLGDGKRDNTYSKFFWPPVYGFEELRYKYSQQRSLF